jgi:hypothetical protein
MSKAHVARPMRLMYATLYSYPSRVSLINLVHSFQHKGKIIIIKADALLGGVSVGASLKKKGPSL